MVAMLITKVKASRLFADHVGLDTTFLFMRHNLKYGRIVMLGVISISLPTISRTMKYNHKSASALIQRHEHTHTYLDTDTYTPTYRQEKRKKSFYSSNIFDGQ